MSGDGNYYQKWSAEDDRDLLEMAQSGWDDIEIANEMGRTLYGVRARRRKLGMLKNSYSHHLWDHDEVQELLELLSAFAEKHNRSVYAICKKGEELAGADS